MLEEKDLNARFTFRGPPLFLFDLFLEQLNQKWRSVPEGTLAISSAASLLAVEALSFGSYPVNEITVVQITVSGGGVS